MTTTIPEQFAFMAKGGCISFCLTAEFGDRLLSSMYRTDGVTLRSWAREITPFYFFDGFRYSAFDGTEVREFSRQDQAEGFIHHKIA